MTDTACSLLCSDIVEQAVEDYRELRRKNKDEIKHKDEGTFSKEDIESFFRGEWCHDILNGLDSRIDGVNILRQLKNEPIQTA